PAEPALPPLPLKRVAVPPRRGLDRRDWLLLLGGAGAPPAAEALGWGGGRPVDALPRPPPAGDGGGPCAAPAPRRYRFAYLTHDTCVTSWFSAAYEIAALVAKRGVALAGNVASVASPTRNTLKSFDRFW